VTKRILLSYLTIAVIVLVALEVPLAIFYQQRETSRLTVDVERDANALASIYEDALEKQTAPDATVASDYAAQTGARVVVVGANGASLIDTGDVTGRDFSGAGHPEVQQALRGTRSTGTRYSKDLKTDLLYVAIPIASGGEILGAVRLTLDTHDVNTLVRRFWLGLVAVAAVVLAVVAGIGWAVARSVTRPLRRLEAAAARFATGDLAAAAPDPTAPPEIVALNETMNTMAQRLEQLLAEHRAFVADASHQLRTPLTALKLRLENLQGDVDGAHDADDLRAAVDETDRLAALVGDLLRLARAERAAEPEIVDLARLARDRVDTWSAIADAVGVRLELTAPDTPIRVAAVPSGVEQILDNLLDNAIAASTSGACVSVTVTEGPGQRSLSVSDQGPGLTAEQKERALDRFWRLDASRPGTGLGLPIAQALAKASGGSLTLADAKGRGLVVTVTLPAA
jgi:signal transduction histidine kinase